MRLEQLGSKNKEELEKIHAEAREELAKSENAWHSQTQALEEGLKQQVIAYSSPFWSKTSPNADKLELFCHDRERCSTTPP